MTEEGVRLSVIVPAYGGERLLRECLTSIAASVAEVRLSTEVIVVLNRVTDTLRVELGSWPELILVHPGRNIGYAGAVVAGVARARGEWVAVFNDDCVLDRSTLAELVAAGESSDEIGSVAALILFTNRERDIVNSAGIEVDRFGVASERMLGEPAAAASAAEVFGASGAAGLYRRRMLDEIGGFDESFFAYLEDVDVAWRARMRGWRAVLAPKALVFHHHSATFGHRSSLKYFLVGRNRVRLLAKNASTSQLLRYGVPIVLYDLAYVLHVALRERTLAPLRGRSRGLLEWRTYRTAGRALRVCLPLAPARGFRSALRRDRAYGRT